MVLFSFTLWSLSILEHLHVVEAAKRWCTENFKCSQGYTCPSYYAIFVPLQPTMDWRIPKGISAQNLINTSLRNLIENCSHKKLRTELETQATLHFGLFVMEIVIISGRSGTGCNCNIRSSAQLCPVSPKTTRPSGNELLYGLIT